MEHSSWRVFGFVVILALCALPESSASGGGEEEPGEGKEGDISPVIPLLAIGLGSVVIGFFIAVFCIFCPCCPWYKRRRHSCNSNSQESLVYRPNGNIPFIKISPTSSVPDVHIIDINQSVEEIDVQKLDMALRKGSRVSVHYY